MSTTHAIEYNLEAAVIAYLQDDDTHQVELPQEIRHAQEDASDDLPRNAIIVAATREEEEAPGVWRLRLTVTLATDSTDTSDSERTQAWSDLAGLLDDDALASTLSQAGELHCFAIRPQGTETSIDGTLHHTAAMFDVYACVPAPEPEDD